MADFDPDSYLVSASNASQGAQPVLQQGAGGPAVAQTPQSGPNAPSFDADAYLHGALQQKADLGPADAEIKAVPDASFWDKVKTEARDALSPLVGESDEQKAERQSSLSGLRNISPTLASAVEQSISPEQKDFQKGGVAKTAGTAVDTGLQTGGAVLGAEVGALGGPAAPVTVPLLSALGGATGDYLAQKRRISEGDQTDVKPGELVASGVMSAIPGGDMAKTGVGAVVRQGVQQGVTGLGSEVLRSEIDDKQLPDIRNAAWSTILPALTGSVAEHVQQNDPEIAAALGAAKAKIASKSATLQAGQDLGMVVEPSQVNPSLINKGVESLAGGPSIKQAASHINQDVADDVARRVLDPANPDVDLTSDLAKAVRQRAYQVGYTPVASAGTIATDQDFKNDLQAIVAKYQGPARSFPGAVNPDVENLIKGVDVGQFDAGDGIGMIQNLRNQASDAFAQGKSGLGQAARGAASALEDQIERHLAAQPAVAGTPSSMLQDFRDARTLMAQSHDIEDAIREGGGSVIPSVLARKAQAQRPLSGDLKTVADFANNFPTMTKEGAKTPVPGTTVTGNAGRVVMGSLLGGATAATTHSPEAATLAAAAGVLLPSVRGLVRSMVLSGPYQRLMAKYPVNVEASPSLGALVIRQGGQAAALQADSAEPAPASP
jgi:hypothetical protein